MLSQWQEHRDPFPVILMQSRFNRRCRGLMQAFNLIQCVVLQGLDVGFELLCEHTDLQVLGDKAYINAAKAAQVWHENRIALQTIPRRNPQKQLPPAVQRLFNSIRQMIETVNAQLSKRFNIEVNHAHIFWGLCTRLYTKLAAHTLCIYLNRPTGKPAFLQIKSLAFPI
ncbi:MAG TPA: transposase [Anaerolineales bacterium]|nr:transposase [Anaerolineales bacterium]